MIVQPPLLETVDESQPTVLNVVYWVGLLSAMIAGCLCIFLLLAQLMYPALLFAYLGLILITIPFLCARCEFLEKNVDHWHAKARGLEERANRRVHIEHRNHEYDIDLDDPGSYPAFLRKQAD